MTSIENYHRINPEPEAIKLSGQLSLGFDDEVRLDREQPYHQLADPELRYRYVGYTEKLIAKIIEDQIDTVVFLDKSARPVSWLMRSLWPTLGIKDFDENGQPVMASQPDMKFVNIDREQWAPSMGRSETKEGGITLNDVHKDTIDSLTGLFALKNMDSDEYVSPSDETMFDGKKVLIVDEVSASGDTLHMAGALFGKAFGNAQSIEGIHWMTPDTKYDKRSGGKMNADLPIWYSSTSALGRLVGDRDIVKSRNSISTRQRRGAQFLSSRFTTRDVLGAGLRDEMQQLGRDVEKGIMPVRPGAGRPDDDAYLENFMRVVNGMSTEEYSALRHQAEKEKAPFTTLFSAYKHDKQNR